MVKAPSTPTVDGLGRDRRRRPDRHRRSRTNSPSAAPPSRCSTAMSRARGLVGRCRDAGAVLRGVAGPARCSPVPRVAGAPIRRSSMTCARARGLDPHLVAVRYAARRTRRRHAAAFRFACRRVCANGGRVTVLDRARDARTRSGGVANRLGSLFIANEAQIDNRRLGRALVAGCAAFGVRFERTAESRSRPTHGACAACAATRGFVPAATVVNAAGAGPAPSRACPPMRGVPVFPVAGEMLALAVPRAFARSLIWHGHTYFVPRDDGRPAHRRHGRGSRFRQPGHRGGIAVAADAALLRRRPRQFRGRRNVGRLAAGHARQASLLGATPLEGYFVAAGHYRNGILLTPITAQGSRRPRADRANGYSARRFLDLTRRTGEAPSPPRSGTGMNVSVNRIERELADGTTLGELIAELGVRREESPSRATTMSSRGAPSTRRRCRTATPSKSSPPSPADNAGAREAIMDDQLQIGKYTFSSRLFVGTGKYPSIPVMQSAHEASGAQVVTVTIRRIHLDDPSGKTMIDYLDRMRYTLLPNTAGCYTAKEAVLTAQARARSARHRSDQDRSDRRSRYALPRHA